MFYKSIHIPIILEVGSDLLPNFNQILKKNFLLFEKRLLITEEFLFEQYKSKLGALGYQNCLLINDSDIEEVYQLGKTIVEQGTLIIGFGGGKVLDVVKLYADQAELPYISIPSTLSNDGIYSPISRLKEKGKKRSFGVKPPLGIIADIDIIKTSPLITFYSGIGDLVSNLSALEDWKLGNIKNGEYINNFAYSLSLLSANSILNYSKKDLYTNSFLQSLAYGLILSGLSMVIAGSSRPCSGAEHQISHAIDELYPDRATLHGIQVAWGHLLVEQKYRRQNIKTILDFFSSVGLNKEIEKLIQFNDEEVRTILEKAVNLRNRYTILNEHLFV